MALRRLMRMVLLGCALCAWFGAPTPVAAQAAGTGAQAKARLVTTFVRFVVWPANTFADDQAPLRLCVMHDSASVAAAFAAYEGSTLIGHRVSVRFNPDVQASGCHVLFVDDSAARGSAPAMSALGTTAVLSIGLVDGFLAQGGMVELVNVNDSYRFDVDLRALRNGNMAVNPGVLKLARQVRS